ncbi:hypothetical protein M9H77_13649 [Catharanthus roseus]|uniref:Uncharacterized protein n=1 Tax=Catharanthus roseus TaxID=4058 RepID=A0ACC0BKV0_CATRO|nr:hypothetical protein M9H77_13649 [Catharanthus roseus]
MEGSKVHWFSILNSLTVITFLLGVVLVILLCAIRRDLTRYEELDKEDQLNEELSRWKLVVGNSLSGLISAILYMGYSLLMAIAVILATGAIGFLSSLIFVHRLFSSLKID